MIVDTDKILYSPRDLLDGNPRLKARLRALKKDVISLIKGGSTINGSTITHGSEDAQNHQGSGSTIQSGSTITRRELDSSRDEWDPEASDLIRWFLDEGQRRIPSEPFQLSPWQRVVDPGLFKEAILFDVSLGPTGPRNHCGAVIADLKRLKELFGEKPNPQEKTQ